jgi:hypothetical protein
MGWIGFQAIAAEWPPEAVQPTPPISPIVMSRDIADGFGQYIADTSHDGARVVGQCLGIGDWCRW